VDNDLLKAMKLVEDEQSSIQGDNTEKQLIELEFLSPDVVTSCYWSATKRECEESKLD
jgi:hypothetical protein